jgi:hypothetical protein
MKSILTFVLVLLWSLPASGSSEAMNFLLQSDPGPFCEIISVDHKSAGRSSARAEIRFGSQGGRIDLEKGMVSGMANDGTEVAVPLAEVLQVRVRFEKDGRSYEYDCLVNALRKDRDWPPKGRIRRVLLTSGVTIDFDRVGPGLDEENGTLFWSCRGEAETHIPWDEVALVQIRSNSFITDINDLADQCALVAIHASSGERMEVRGMSGWWDHPAGLVRFDGEEVPLDAVWRLEVVDRRGREFEEPEPLEEDAEVQAKTPVEGYDLDNLDLLDKKVKIKVSHGGRSWVTGTVTDQSAQTLKMFVGEGVVTVPGDQIEELKISQGSGGNAGTGALIGAGIVGAAGLGLGIAMAADGFFTTSNGDVVAITVFGAGAGALLGAAIGAVVKTEKWEDVPKVSLEPVMAPDKSPGLGLSWNF